MGMLPLAFLAGLLSVLSPCVLPILPIVFATAASKHRYGPLALAAGLVISFVAIGLFVALVGFSLGLDHRLVRAVAATLFIAIGLVLLFPRAQTLIATGLGPVSGWAEGRSQDIGDAGLAGQFAVGVLLGAVWTPCVGPTLGAVSILAARGQNLIQVSLTMMIFGLGAALPLLAIGSLSRTLPLRLKENMLAAGRAGKIVLGVALVGFGLLILSGFDKKLESRLVEMSPQWLTDLTIRY